MRISTALTSAIGPPRDPSRRAIPAFMRLRIEPSLIRSLAGTLGVLCPLAYQWPAEVRFMGRRRHHAPSSRMLDLWRVDGAANNPRASPGRRPARISVSVLPSHCQGDSQCTERSQVEVELLLVILKASPSCPCWASRFPSLMLGVRRAGVTETLQSLKQRKLIDNRRNQIVVLDRPGIEQVAGNSYGVSEKEYRRLFG